MITKRRILILIFFISFLFQTKAVRRGGGSKSRIGVHSYSAGNLSHDFPQDPGRAIGAVVFMILSCGAGIGWKCYKYHRKDQQRKSLQPRIPYPNCIFTNSYLSPTIDPINQTDSLSQKSTLITLSVESLKHSSEKSSCQNLSNQTEIQKSKSKEEMCPITISVQDVNASSHTGYIGTLL